jgi:hypothetical protein
MTSSTNVSKARTGRLARGLASAAVLALVGTAAHADAVIFNTGNAETAQLALGIYDFGHLNVRDPFGTVSTANAGGYFGLAYKFPDGNWRDATSPGCLCEGWGVSATSSSGANFGYANADDTGSGAFGLTLVGTPTTDAAAGTGSFFTTTAQLTSLPGLTVTHEFTASPDAPGQLFVAKITITNNTGETLNDVRYTRVMDWDIPPTEFFERVTIAGTATTTALEISHNDGFQSGNPLSPGTGIFPGGSLNTDFEALGPADHGAYFGFNFGTLADGESYVFEIFYGAAATEALALLALGAVSAELYSLGQNGTATYRNDVTFMFGFRGVGGEIILPPPPTRGVPEPGTLALLGLGLVAVSLRRRRSA